MNYANLLYRLPEDLIGIFRKYELEKKKEINAHWSLVFNKTCLSENIWPNFTNIYIYIVIQFLKVNATNQNHLMNFICPVEYYSTF